ncbi:unnamed protein product [Clonostachys chloroleuca]|uniref:Uncharacterized protein n=1 Tax=Clonostachys chloroleuca TaxID=1926264 RepID=A0AA35QDV5_9HYPO|nr:unnamed protein product [Clonostachys chloroleuca]
MLLYDDYSGQIAKLAPSGYPVIDNTIVKLKEGVSWYSKEVYAPAASSGLKQINTINNYSLKGPQAATATGSRSLEQPREGKSDPFHRNPDKYDQQPNPQAASSSCSFKRPQTGKSDPIRRDTGECNQQLLPRAALGRSQNGVENREVDPIMLSIFGHRFMSLAEQMGNDLLFVQIRNYIQVIGTGF